MKHMSEALQIRMFNYVQKMASLNTLSPVTLAERQKLQTEALALLKAAQAEYEAQS